MKSVRFQLRVIRKETETPLRVESESNLQYFTVLWRLCILILLFFVKYACWPPTYFFPHRLRKGHRDYCVQCLRSEVTPVDSKVYYHPVFALSQCAQIIDRYKFFLLTTRAPQSNLDYNLGQNRMKRQTPIPNKHQSRTKPLFSILGG